MNDLIKKRAEMLAHDCVSRDWQMSGVEGYNQMDDGQFFAEGYKSAYEDFKECLEALEKLSCECSVRASEALDKLKETLEK